MAIKPVTVLAMPARFQVEMFREEDLARLGKEVRIVLPPSLEPASLYPMLADADTCITGWGSPRFSTELLAAAPKLRFVAHSAGGLKAMVSDAMFDRGIRVTTAASANAVPVAHFTVAMMVAMLKQMPWFAPAMAQNNDTDQRQRMHQCRELMDISVGLIGASRIGRLVIGMLKSFPGLTIKVYDPYLARETANELGVELASLEDTCRCEVVSVHAPSIPETRHMLNGRTLALLPDHAVLINTSRGSLIDEAALVAEVRRRPLYVLLDVTDPEPPPANSPLRREPNILLTPHVAGSMKQARKDMGRLAIEETLRFLRGQALQNEVTRAMLPTQA
jgi:phosphoglycerate dehydrogenase-like enzyme